MVPSSEVVPSKNTAIMVASPALKASYTFLGSISLGMAASRKLVYQMTDSTWSTVSSFSFSACTSPSAMPSMTMNEKAPLPNCSISSSCPTIVSMSEGR